MKGEFPGPPAVALVIDDDPFIRLLARDCLEKMGLTVHEACDGKSGLAAMSRLKLDVVLLDVMMPDMTGFEVCRQARLLPELQFCPIVVLTALGDMDAVAQACEAGATDFVHKPINWLLLEHRLRFILKAARSLRAVARSDMRMAQAQRISQVGSWEWELASDTVRCSEEMARICGLPPLYHTLSYPEFLALAHPADRATREQAMRAALAHGPAYDLEFRLLLADDTVRHVHGKADVRFDADGLPLTMSGTLQDISQRKQAEARIFYLANYDVLTGLPNRNLLDDRLTQAIAQARRGGQWATLACLDLDGFKFINDSYGHVVGDGLLKAVASRLRAALRESDTVARLGGDEFVLVCLGQADSRDVLCTADKVLAQFQEPFLVENHVLHVTASVGLCICPEDGDSADVLLKNADVAMYAAKEAGRNCFRAYAHEMGCRVLQRVELEAALRQALEQRQFELHYQPKLDLRTGKLNGVEALIRWNHPQRGMVPPDSFIALAEETRLIVPIGEWVMRTACAQAKAWHAMGHEQVTVAVNLSARQFDQQNLARLVMRVLAETGLPPRCLELELTESVLMSDCEAMLAVLRDIKALGVTLTLDDFGTGYSSLAYLKRFPIDVLKIDRSFVRNVTTDADDASLTRTIVLMAQSLKMKTVAEGVETEGQMHFLANIKCDAVQGYYFSRPVPAAALTAMLEAHTEWPLLANVAAARRTVLLLDDEPNVLSALARVFRKEDCTVLQTTSPQEAFELLAKHQVQVIISDQRMAVMSGTTFLGRVKELYPETIRIILSGYTELSAVIEAINQGAVYRFFTKPWDDDYLRTQLRLAFEHHWLIHGKSGDPLPSEELVAEPASQ